MAIYTPLTQQEIFRFLSLYDLGALTGLEAIPKGVSNTNYHVFTDKGRYVLSIFEERRTRRSDLPFLFDWAAHLAKKDILCPQAVPGRDGQIIRDIHGKPAVLVNFLEGEDIPRGETTAEHCRQMGEMTARLHLASMDFPLSRANDWPLSRFTEIAWNFHARLKTYDSDLYGLVTAELAYLDKNRLDHLPRTVVHTDLFPDNVFFLNGKIHAVIDLYFACTHALLYDLAVVVNAWCFSADGEFRQENFRALMEGYKKIRPLEEKERKSFQTALRLASMRFLMSRAEELFTHNPDDTVMQPHDPREYIHRLCFHQKNTLHV